MQNVEIEVVLNLKVVIGHPRSSAA